MRFRILVLILPFLWLTVLLLGAPLDGEIEALISSRGAASRAHWGVHAVDLGTGNVLAEVNAEKLFVPASTRKLVSTAMAAKYLPEGPIQTVVHVPSVGGDGTVSGDLVLEAMGDPSWTPELTGGRPGRSRLRDLAKQVAQAGVRRVTGNLVVDASAFSTPAPLPPSWDWDDFLFTYAGTPAVLSLDRNIGSVKFTPGAKAGDPVGADQGANPAFEIVNLAKTGAAGSAPTFEIARDLNGQTLTLRGSLPAGSGESVRGIPMGRPVEVAAKEFWLILAEEGVAIEGGITLADQDRPTGQVIATVEGATLPQILKRTNEESDNYLAESLYLLAGKARHGTGSYRAAQAAEEQFWKSLKVDLDKVVGHDGSGLSSMDLVTPTAMTTLLQGMRETELFTASLPVSGKTGTLSYRLTDNGLAGRVRAKTGTLSNVSALAGYLELSNGRVIVFAVLANHYDANSTTIRRTIDDIVALLAR